jgi:hypothetical protein
VFTACANIAKGLVVNSKIGLAPKMGFILASGTCAGIAMNLVRSVHSFNGKVNVVNDINLVKINISDASVFVNDNLKNLNSNNYYSQ